jgi:hypothetical protein
MAGCWLVSLLLALMSTVAAAEDFYIAPNGSDDSGDGTINKPWATIVRAQVSL